MTDWLEVYQKAVADLTDDPEDEFGLSYASCVRDNVVCAGKSDSEVVHAADLGMIKAARLAVGDPLMPDNSDKWWDNLEAIARGESPLDKLPEHVRELARELYYKE
ncbi:hypothetical protein KAU45_04515 [bacterium]|nr:hypothetical protein [bacterium]